MLLTLCYGWTGTTRFQNALVSCLLGCGGPTGDAQEHFLACPVFSLWCHRRLPDVRAGGITVTSALLRGCGLSGYKGFLHSVALDVVRFAVDRRWHGNRGRPDSHARMGQQELGLRHSVVRAIRAALSVSGVAS